MLCSSILYIGILTSANIEEISISNFLNSKPEALKRESLLNTFADGGLNIIDIRTKSSDKKLSSVLAGYTP